MKLHEVIARLRSAKKNDEGFTLIELLVVVVIIGVLVAIAVPVYLNYRQGAADKAAQSDVRGAISAVEQFYTTNSNSYPVDTDSSSASNGKINLPVIVGSTGGQAGSITISDGTTLTLNVDAATDTYLICAWNEGGNNNKWFRYDSAAGGSVTDMNTAQPAAGTCA
jgi:type IV pilus assembly protein PilA